MDRSEPGKTSSVVGGFPQAVYADIRGLVTASFCSTVAVIPLYGRALVRAVCPRLSHRRAGCRPVRRFPGSRRFMQVVCVCCRLVGIRIVPAGPALAGKLSTGFRSENGLMQLVGGSGSCGQLSGAGDPVEFPQETGQLTRHGCDGFVAVQTASDQLAVFATETVLGAP